MSTETQPSFPPPAANRAPPMSAVDFALMMQLHRQIDERIARVERLLEQVVINQTSRAQQVMVNDVSMSFGAMVLFMVKWAIASIPAAIILIALGWFVMLFFGGLLIAMFR